MKNTILLLSFLIINFSCKKIERKINDNIRETAQKMVDDTKREMEEDLKKHFDETIKSISNSEDIAFSKVFKNNDLLSLKSIKAIQSLDSIKGKRIQLPTGSIAIIFKYKIEKQVLLQFLQCQPTTDEAKSDKVAKKIDGEKLMAKLKMVEVFLPKEITDNPIFKESKDNNSLKIFRINRIPLQSTLIYNPKDSTFFHLVDAKIEK